MQEKGKQTTQRCSKPDAAGTVHVGVKKVYLCNVVNKGVIKTEPHGWESPQPYLMVVGPSQVYPRVDYVRTRAGLGGANDH